MMYTPDYKSSLKERQTRALEHIANSLMYLTKLKYEEVERVDLENEIF